MPMPHYSVAAETAWLLALFGARQPDGHPLLRCSRGWASIATSRSTDANDVGYGDTGQVVTGTNEGESGVVRDLNFGNRHFGTVRSSLPPRRKAPAGSSRTPTALPPHAFRRMARRRA
ncbi:hypothetical protein GCM10008101_05890 [Lysobacter xinjiangensis]|uniref:Uncharacterized protein n=1 Tax=Cognatilysobacter xinjiangensis TaxID=546892 RepID=A0ABQ3BU32_9GAMM|nr:hypothetical protein GCM10008101_05890 [Lysobacter xinjiangensis]